MNFDSRLKSILLALVGVLSIALYFGLLISSKPMQLLRFQTTKQEIVAKATQAYKDSPLGEYNWPHSLRVSVDDDLFRYAQALPANGSAQNNLPLGQWEISWEGKLAPSKSGPVVITTDSEKKKDAGHFTVRYDFTGKLVGFDQAMPQAQDSTNLSEPAALQKAREFLAALQVDTAAAQLTKRETLREGNRTRHKLTFTGAAAAADWQETFYVGILGTVVTQYDADLKLYKEKLQRSKFEEVSDIVTTVLSPVVWVVVSIFLLIIFFRRLRHDELEFKRAIWVGIIVGLAMWVMIAVSSWPEWAGVLIGGGMGGLFVGAGMLLVYAAAESLQREVWKEKLALVDLLFRGYARVGELGHAILRSFFIAGLTLLLLGGIVWLAAHFNIASLEIDNDDLWIFQDQYHVIAALSIILMASSYVGMMFLAFWPSYIRSKTSSLKILLLLTGLFFSLSGLHLNFLKPSYWSFALFLPVAFLWAWFVYRHDFLTMLLALAAVNYFRNFSLITLLPDGFSSAAGVTTDVLVFLTFAAGVYFVFSKNSVKDFENYVPAYVSRIAERERFLKELEIARSIQMRFLPARPPVFPKLEIACLCKPAMEVGGDYYDFIKHDESRLGVVIGDVSGKGVSAAFFMTMAKGIIKALSRINPSPKSLLSDMNTVFYENTPKEVFISLIYGFFDVQNNTLIFARAGHNPLIVRKSVGGAPELLNPRGLAIGMEKGPVFSSTIEEKAVPIQKGDIFMFYTDGISEAMNKNGDEFGEDRLSQLVSQHAQESAQAILDKITHDVIYFANGAKQHDDFTMVVVKVVG
jgi:MFS family permease